MLAHEQEQQDGRDGQHDGEDGGHLGRVVEDQGVHLGGHRHVVGRTHEVGALRLVEAGEEAS